MEFAGNWQRAENLLREQASADICPETTALSLPVAVELPGGELADAFFGYDQALAKGRPFAWAKLDSTMGAVLFYARCDVCDFAPENAPPPGAELTLTPFRPMEPEERAASAAQLQTLYQQLRPFLFTAVPTPEQQEQIVEYASLFEQLVWQEHRPFYRKLAGPFLDWLGLDFDGWSTGVTEENTAARPDLAAEVRELSRLFVRKIETDRHKDQLFDRMHAELQEYKNDLLDSLTRPIEGDVIKLIDDVEKSMEVYRGRPFSDDNYRRLLTLFEGIKTDLIDLLYRHGLEPFSQEGDEVTMARQKILATVPTGEQALDKTVAVRHAKGWEKNSRVVRPERISAYVYTPPEERTTGEKT